MIKILILIMIILKCTLVRFSCYNSCHMGLEKHVTHRDLRLTEGEVNLAPVCPVAPEMPLYRAFLLKEFRSIDILIQEWGKYPFLDSKISFFL